MVVIPGERTQAEKGHVTSPRSHGIIVDMAHLEFQPVGLPSEFMFFPFYRDAFGCEKMIHQSVFRKKHMCYTNSGAVDVIILL